MGYASYAGKLASSMRVMVVVAVLVVLASACGGSGTSGQGSKARVEKASKVERTTTASHGQTDRKGATAQTAKSEPSKTDVYAHVEGTRIKPSLKKFPERVYVPNMMDNTVDVINPHTFTVVDHYAVGVYPYHITPSWDMKHLYVEADKSNELQVIDPKTGELTGQNIKVPYPYNLYFTPDGKQAIVVTEFLGQLGFYDPHTWKLLGTIKGLPKGVDHLDFSADGSYFLISSEFNGIITRVNVKERKVTGALKVGGQPIDVKVSPDGKVFYVANQAPGYNGVSVIDPRTMKQIKFIPTGQGAHGLQVSRDGKYLYVSNRYEGSISVISFAKRKVVAKWQVGGSPDMFQISPDGKQLWYSDRFNGTVSVVDTRSGKLLHRIPVGFSPHGLSYFPNVGRFCIGHNGVYR